MRVAKELRICYSKLSGVAHLLLEAIKSDRNFLTGVGGLMDFCPQALLPC